MSWIDARYLPDVSGLDVLTDAEKESEWIFKTYYGLGATANATPPDRIVDFRGFESKQDFRALMFYHFRASIDERTAQIGSWKVLDATHNAGFTPPFSYRKNPGGLIIPSTWKAQHHSPGIASDLSVIKGLNRHANSTIDINGRETVLANGMIKFRAGEETDNMGVKEVGAPYHVPWVWCEIALTVAPVTNAPPVFILYGRGSPFPSHAWYFNHEKIMVEKQLYDLTLPKNASVSNTKIGQVLMIGARSTGPQVTSAERQLTGAIHSHPNTVQGGPVRRCVVKPR